MSNDSDAQEGRARFGSDKGFGRSRKKSPEQSLDQASADLVRKVPPHNLDAEQAVLGGVFLDPKIFNTLVDIVTTDDFYFPAHRTIFNIFLELDEKGRPLDLVTVGDRLKQEGKLEQIGGPLYLGELTQTVIKASSAVHHARIVRDNAVRRALISTSASIISESFESAKDVDELLAESEQAVYAIAHRTQGSLYQSSKQLVVRVFDELTARFERQELVTGVSTGYHRLNEITAGLQPSDLIIVAARPSMGKTAFALNVAMRAAVQHNVSTAIFSLEMSMDQLMMRMLCAWGKVDLSRLRRGFLDDDDWTGLHMAADSLSPAPIYIDDTPALSTLELRARCRRMASERGLGLVVVDYLQLMRVGRRIDSREQEISEISRTLKALAKELHVPVMALSQLNRKVEERTNKRPLLSDLRESGAIEQDADVIMFLYRDEVYNKSEDNPKRGIAEVIIGKQRNGPVGMVELAFLDSCTAFEELAEMPVPSELAGG